jgi:hypothetical protein
MERAQDVDTRQRLEFQPFEHPSAGRQRLIAEASAQLLYNSVSSM